LENIDTIISNKARTQLFEKYKEKFSRDPFLSRKIVSFQANKTNPIYRWFKYKEGFSSNLVEYYIKKFNLEKSNVLDPFAGTGTTLFTASSLGCNSIGIELLPVCIFFMNIRKDLSSIKIEKLKELKASLWNNVSKEKGDKSFFNHIPITKGAFPEHTEIEINKYISYTNTLPKEYSNILKFILFSVLEAISYTRKDGQYLRWDYRSGRSRTKFDKGKILEFKIAIDLKFDEIIEDLSDNSTVSTLFPKQNNYPKGQVNIIEGSSLYKLAEIKKSSIDIVITSPPYVNRYDYTRTYALELVFLGINNEEIKELRQTLLSSTVENKSKVNQLREFFKDEIFNKVMSVYNSNSAMTEVINILTYYKKEKKLNNSGILRMVENYFIEMNFIIYELSRVLKKGGRTVMVNDNVRYVGEEIPVDLILSEFAASYGLETEKIYVLDQNKGNSSQQMGAHGRSPLRKCVYLWRKI
jgi:DNA modification methylase